MTYANNKLLYQTDYEKAQIKIISNN